MTDWFARPVLHVTDAFTLTGSASQAPWRYEQDGSRSLEPLQATSRMKAFR
jgi:hypothetical protein